MRQTNFWLLMILAATVASIFGIYDFKQGRSTIQLGLDLRSGSHITVRLKETPDPKGNIIKVDRQVLERAIQVFHKRLNPDGTQEIQVTPEDPDRLIVEIPEMTDLDKAIALVKKAARLEFREASYNPAAREKETWVTLMDGSAISHAAPAPAGEKEWQVEFQLTSEGTREFGDITRRLLGKPLGIFFDGKMISAPIVQSPITGGSGVITNLNGRVDEETGKQITAEEEAVSLANFLNAGALPVDVEVMEAYTVSPTLGAESLRYSLIAGLIGLGVVCVYMIGYYKIPGVTASVALVFYSLLVLASMNIPGLKFVLTLPGIAGFILSIGMAVDANVLIFERLKEELWRDKSLNLAVDLAFDRAWSSILDGHVTTFIGAFILYYIGSASIKGFGLTLMLGTAWSMITAVFVTRAFMDFCVHNLRLTDRKAYGA